MPEGRTTIVCLNSENEDYGLYISGYRNPDTGTPLFYRGTLDEILDHRRS